MANWPTGSFGPPREGVTALFSCTLNGERRLSVPVEVREAVSWLSKGTAKQDVLFLLAEPGRVIVLEADAHMADLLAGMEESETEAERVRLLYSRGSFVRDRLIVTDRVAPHLVGHPVGPEDIKLHIRAYEGNIEIWSQTYWTARVQATE